MWGLERKSIIIDSFQVTSETANNLTERTPTIELEEEITLILVKSL